MMTQFVAAGATIAAVYRCPYHPDGPSPYNLHAPLRKPAPGMLLLAAKVHNLDIGRSVLIGDQESDIAAGKAAGVIRTDLLSLSGPRAAVADVVITSHAEICTWLLREPPRTLAEAV